MLLCSRSKALFVFRFESRHCVTTNATVMEYRNSTHYYEIPDTALECVFAYVNDAADRNAISVVCKKWLNLENLTRREVTIAFCYSMKPSRLPRRFKRLEALKLKGQPRAAMFNLIPVDWGGYAEPWVREISLNCQCLKSIHFRRMVVSDDDLLTLAKERGHMLQVLKLDKCYGFSTTGLDAITRCCRSLRALVLDDSTIEDRGGKWLHELALHNTSLEVLNFSALSPLKVEMADLESVVSNCEGLTSLKVNEVEISKLCTVFSKSTALQELGGITIPPYSEENEIVHLPRSLTSLVGILYTGDDEGDRSVISTILPLASGLKRLDLQCAFLSVEGHCQLLQNCSNLEVLEVLNDIGDEGLEVLANTCKNLRRLRVENSVKEVQQGFVTHKGLLSVAQGCGQLEYIAVYISNINNAVLTAFGEGCPKLRDFRVVLVEDENSVFDSTLDEGIMPLLQGCSELTRLALYLRPGLLTDRGMGYIGKFGCKLRWVLLGLLGESDMGLSWFADGCPNLERLEIRDCVFSEAGIARAVPKLKSLKYIWVQGYQATATGQDLLVMRRPFWNIEFIPERLESEEAVPTVSEEALGLYQEAKIEPAQFLAYRSLGGVRTDNPETIICLG